MFLKRTLILALGVLLFVTGFIGYFEYTDAQMESQFRQERRENGVDTGVLTTQIASSSPAPAATSPSSFSPAPATTPAPTPLSDSTGAMPPSSTPDTTPAPEAAPTPAAMDTGAGPISPAATSNGPDTNNIIIGPMPPSSTPSSSPSSSNSAPSNTNSNGPMPPTTSTMLSPVVRDLARIMLAGYTPLPTSGVFAQAGPSVVPTVSAPAPATTPAPSPVTNTTETAAPVANVPTAPSATTNTVPSAPEPGTARPVPVEASVIVLLYHQFVPPGAHISPKFQWTLNQDVFETEMKYLHDNGYHVVPMSDLLKFLRHEIGLPPNSVVITIDDGYKSAIVYAAPILKKYGFPWTFFVYPDFITTAESKGAASWSDLLALQADGVDIECHSMTHPILPSHHQRIKGVWHNLSPAEYDQWLTNETAGAKALLEQKMGKPIPCFAYPYGSYNKQVEAKVIAAGFSAIFTVADNPVRSTTSMYSIGRYTITQAVVKNYYAYLRQGALGLAEMDPAPGTTITNPRPVITVVLSYAGTIDPSTIETSVRDFGVVRHDFDPKTSTLRLYLPRNLVEPVNLVNIRAKDAQSGQIVVANWRFNYEAPGAAPVHPPIGGNASTTNSTPAVPTNGVATTAPATNAPPAISSSASVSATTAPPATNQADPPQASTVVH